MKSKSIYRVLAIIVPVVLALVGCSGLSQEEQLEAKFYATQYAQDPAHNIPPAKYQTLAATALGMYLPPATPTPNMNYTPTMSFYDFSGTQVAQQQAISLTQNAVQAQQERDRLAAEERARREEEEAKQAKETAIAYSHQQTAEARIFYGQQTAQAEGTQMMATAQAQATATMWSWQISQQDTAVAAQATAQVLPTHQIFTMEAMRAQATVQAGEAEKVALAVRRQEMKNVFDAYLPWILIVGAVLVLGRGFAEYVKTRVHSRDEHGAVPLLQLRADNGDTILVKPEELETGIMKVQKDGSVIRYGAMDAQEQSDIKRRNQAIEAIRALPTPYAQTGAKIITSEFNTTHARVTMGSTAPLSSVLDEADRGFLEEAKDG